MVLLFTAAVCYYCMLLTFSNRSRTRLAPTPTNSSTNSEAAHEKKGVPASPATALASRVLPVPAVRDSRHTRQHGLQIVSNQLPAKSMI